MALPRRRAPRSRTWRHLGILPTLSLALGCSPLAAPPAPAAPPVEGKILAACAGASVIILGERHREAESHELFLDLVAALALRGERLAVGLEIPSDRQGQLDEALAGLRSSAGVAHPIVDSPSYAGMIEGLGRLAASLPEPMEVLALDAPVGKPCDRDLEMASRVGGALAGGRWDRVVLLAGNLHALKAVPWSAKVREPHEKLAGLLAGEGLRVASLVQTFPEGCAGERRATFHPAGDRAAAAAVKSLWGLLNTDPAAAGSLVPQAAADGVVSWACSD